MSKLKTMLADWHDPQGSQTMSDAIDLVAAMNETLDQLQDEYETVTEKYEAENKSLHDRAVSAEKMVARLEEVNAVNLDLIKQYQADVKRLRVIYDLANEFMAELGRDGEIKIDAQSKFAGEWMNALFDIDGGYPDPQALKEVSDEQ